MELRDTTPNDGPVFVTCDNPQHPTRRFPTVAVAESYLLGNAIDGDCLYAHKVSEPARELADLLASLMPDHDGYDPATMPACEADA